MGSSLNLVFRSPSFLLFGFGLVNLIPGSRFLFAVWFDVRDGRLQAYVGIGQWRARFRRASRCAADSFFRFSTNRRPVRDDPLRIVGLAF